MNFIFAIAKRNIFVICLFFTIIYLLLYPLSTLHKVSTTMTTSQDYYNWEGDSGEDSSQICFPIEFAGRMGNIMFIYATAVGLCVFHKASLESCVVLPQLNTSKNNREDVYLPVRKVVQGFDLPHSRRPCNKRNFSDVLNKTNKVFKEHDGDLASYFYDPKIFEQSPGTLLVGYFQSWKYFNSAQEEVRKAFKFPAYANREALRFINYIHQIVSITPFSGPFFSTSIAATTTTPLVTIVAIHVRLGDKISKNITTGSYNTWALSVDYYLKAIHLVQQRRRESNRVLAYAIFIGGSVTKNTKNKDVAWTKKYIGKKLNSPYVFYESSGDEFTSMRTLMHCDVIITAHSTFSWWGAYLSESMEIYAPRNVYHYLSTHRVEVDDYYPPWWTLLSDNPKQDRIVGYNPDSKTIAVHNGSRSLLSESK